MLHSEDFTSLLDTAKKNIEEGMMSVLAQNGKGEPSVIVLRCFCMPRL
jgi:hypothetical protein